MLFFLFDEMKLLDVAHLYKKSDSEGKTNY